jgi:flagellar biogenesis protein FliO
VWILSGLAIVATISLLFYAGMLLLIASGQSSFVSHLASVQVLLHLVEAILLVLLVRWLVARGQNPNTP